MHDLINYARISLIGQNVRKRGVNARKRGVNVYKWRVNGLVAQGQGSPGNPPFPTVAAVKPLAKIAHTHKYLGFLGDLRVPIVLGDLRVPIV